MKFTKLMFGLALLILLVFQIPMTAQELGVANANRPANVPEGFVITPFGYFHPSCVKLLPEGDTLLADGSVAHANGTVEAASVCNYEHYTPTGEKVPADVQSIPAVLVPTLSGWLESVSVTTSTSYGKIATTWPVPPSPTSNDGQTLFFFPGFEDINNVISIVQPVLQWGPSAAGGGAFWAVSSWNCCLSGTADYSPLLDVNVGDIILGTIAPNCKPGKNYCATWNVVSKDQTTGKKTTLAKTPADSQEWNWAFGAVSEDYGVVQCSDFPNDSSLTFTVHLYDQNRIVIPSPNWQGKQWQNPTPNCHYGWKITKTHETVKY